MPFFLSAQDLQKHQWENRLIVIQAPVKNDPLLLKQLQGLKEINELKDRKIAVYQFVENEFRFTDHVNPSKSTPWQARKTKGITTFKVQLIGLDGGVKLEKTTPLTMDELYAIIDAMPMRRRELRRKEKDN